jgi:hypothetical protein
MQATTAYAREIAKLKVRLVEKDAQLMGGFGNPAKLQDDLWTLPPFTPLHGAPGSHDFGGVKPHSFGFEDYRDEQRARASWKDQQYVPR